MSPEERADLIVLLPKGLQGISVAANSSNTVGNAFASNVEGSNNNSSSNTVAMSTFFSGAVLLRAFGPRRPDAVARQQGHSRHHKSHKEHFSVLEMEQEKRAGRSGVTPGDETQGRYVHKFAGT
jgi:hypothetical protein